MINSFKIWLVMILLSFNGLAQQRNWVAPIEANNLFNPLKGDVLSITEGKKIYTSMCVVCHGTSGKGNGVAGVSLEPHPANFLSITIKDESDGAIFWKITEGRAPMASYKTLLTEKQRWQLVSYIRKLENMIK